MHRMTEQERAEALDWEVRQGAFDDPAHLDLTLSECLIYAIGGVAACALSSFWPWGFA